MAKQCGLRILLYHAVGTRLRHDPYGISISTELFERHMALLAGIKDIRPVGLLDWRPASQGLHVAVTFDDGYRDNYTFALPILERFNLKATFYLVTGYIGSDRVFEWIRDSKGMSDDVSVSRSEFMPLNWDQVLEMERRGMEFGSHSHSHRSLSEIDPGIIAGELGESIRELEKHLSDGAYSFACPFGVWREAAEKLKELVQGSGYSGAFLGKWGALKKKAHPYDMPRLTIYGWDSLGVFQRKIGGSYDWLHFLYSGWHFLRTSILGKNRKQEKGFG